MILVRSTFWLAVAYFAIGPQLDFSESVDDLSAQAMHSGQNFVTERINATRCSSLECMGAKLTISASLDAAPEPFVVIPPDQNGISTLIVPVPEPRLPRTG